MFLHQTLVWPGVVFPYTRRFDNALRQKYAQFLLHRERQDTVRGTIPHRLGRLRGAQSDQAGRRTTGNYGQRPMQAMRQTKSRLGRV